MTLRDNPNDFGMEGHRGNPCTSVSSTHRSTPPLPPIALVLSPTPRAFPGELGFFLQQVVERGLASPRQRSLPRHMICRSKSNLTSAHRRDGGLSDALPLCSRARLLLPRPVLCGREARAEVVGPKAFQLKHLRPGTLSLCLAENDDYDEIKLDPDYRNVEFLVTTEPGPFPQLHDENIVFGTVLEGVDVRHCHCHGPHSQTS